jgi:hypothetical protein
MAEEMIGSTSDDTHWILNDRDTPNPESMADEKTTSISKQINTVEKGNSPSHCVIIMIQQVY